MSDSSLSAVWGGGRRGEGAGAFEAAVAECNVRTLQRKRRHFTRNAAAGSRQMQQPAGATSGSSRCPLHLAVGSAGCQPQPPCLTGASESKAAPACVSTRPPAGSTTLLHTWTRSLELLCVSVGVVKLAAQQLQTHIDNPHPPPTSCMRHTHAPMRVHTVTQTCMHARRAHRQRSTLHAAFQPLTRSAKGML